MAPYYFHIPYLQLCDSKHIYRIISLYVYFYFFNQVMSLYRETFPNEFPIYEPSKKVSINNSHVQCGHSFLPRVQHQQPINSLDSIHLLHHCLDPLESVMKCVEMNWLSIIVSFVSFILQLSKFSENALTTDFASHFDLDSACKCYNDLLLRKLHSNVDIKFSADDTFLE